MQLVDAASHISLRLRAKMDYGLSSDLRPQDFHVFCICDITDILVCSLYGRWRAIVTSGAETVGWCPLVCSSQALGDGMIIVAGVTFQARIDGNIFSSFLRRRQIDAECNTSGFI